MRTTTKVLALAGLVIGLGGEAVAQTPQGGPPSGGSVRAMAPGSPVRMMQRGPSVTAVLNARRELELTPRQVAQLDSIERVVFAERQRVVAAQRPAMDSLRTRIRTEGAPDERQRAEMRTQAESRRAALRPELERLRRSDSTASAAAERLLTDTQRTKWGQMQAERRGFERGVQAGRSQGARGPQRMIRPQGRGGEAGRPGMTMPRRQAPPAAPGAPARP
jgi:hypothetical protein